MKENITRGILLVILILGIYFIATLLRPDDSYRGAPEDMVGNCTAYGDCY